MRCILLEALRRAGQRGLLSSGWAGFGADKCDLGPDMMVIGSASHAALFPRMRAIVHHGGAGTTAAAARAGIPQVVIPHVFDQFLNARSVELAGLGVALERSRLSVHRLTDCLRRLLGEPSYALRARAVGERIRARNPLSTISEHLESLIVPPSVLSA